jgi:hypothetical protein
MSRIGVENLACKVGATSAMDGEFFSEISGVTTGVQCGDQAREVLGLFAADRRGRAVGVPLVDRSLDDADGTLL